MYEKQQKPKGITVYVRDDRVDQAIRKLKKKVTETGLLREVLERETYTKPTTKRKQEKNLARRRWLKKLAAEQLPKKLY